MPVTSHLRPGFTLQLHFPFFDCYMLLNMLASVSWHFSHFQSENGNKYFRWTSTVVIPKLVVTAHRGSAGMGVV